MRALITEIGEEKQFNQLFFKKKTKNIATLLMPRVRAKENTGEICFFRIMSYAVFGNFRGLHQTNLTEWRSAGLAWPSNKK